MQRRGDAAPEGNTDIGAREGPWMAPSARPQGKRRGGMFGSSVWRGGASEMNTLRPNIGRKQEEIEDDEVP